ncbi:MAG: methionine--tRNA ligase [Candidatus Adlerbacteria bacterium]|nr:methionine--tRNA ligase [Candidatus Adlerbacteria bacterium]
MEENTQENNQQNVQPQETAQPEVAAEAAPVYLSIDDFHKVEIKVGEIMSAEKIEGSDKLLKLKVNFGPEDRQVLSGIAVYYPDPVALVGIKCAFVTNLKPRMMMGMESQAMILATGGGEEPLALFRSDAPPGSQAR